MTGVEIVGTLLTQHAPLLAKVPTVRIMADMLPENVPLPALLVSSIDTIERVNLSRGDKVRLTERVRVTVRAKTGEDCRTIIKLVRDCCAGWTGNMPGAERIAITNGGTGPSIAYTGPVFEQAQDFRVSFEETISG